MPKILETKNFTVVGHERPHQSRENGGHVVITPKKRYAHRYEMPLSLGTALMHLSMIVGEATTNIMRKNGLDVARINYQDNGNWSYKPIYNKPPHLHVHLYVRTKGESHPDKDKRFQAFPDALVFAPPESDYYKNFKPLTEKDCQDIKEEFERLLATDRYQDVEFKYSS